MNVAKLTDLSCKQIMLILLHMAGGRLAKAADKQVMAGYKFFGYKRFLICICDVVVLKQQALSF